ncbi:LacI family DNA-binding transcriptional regulator [Kocuria sp.]|uniref:LacI family DNA-binding transcriptional regulator n=1 Tax=Kocuria sp. TaxID=1871328 RepID=UPI0026DFD6A6|nr:LacI family DNA-binding transcriptional regulator [Kocuria sp.]MDO5618516.1 LacI family DNA-binding transcriptional regulator [Kocuria sp.]
MPSPASIKDVAQAAGVSIGTVSNVLNRPDMVSEARRRRVLQAIEDLGYVRNDAARQLKAGRSLTVGLIVQDSGNPYYHQLAQGAEEGAEALGQAVIVGSAGYTPEREQLYLDLFEQQRVRGVLLTPQTADHTRTDALRERNIPVVLVDEHAPPGDYCSLAVDDVEGGRMAAEHLLAQGARSIAFVGGPNTLHQIVNRRAGAQTAVDAVQGASLESFNTAALSILEGRRIGEIIRERPRKHLPDAVFAANDLLALGLLQAFVFGNHLRVPQDILLIGYDDIDYAASAVVALSSVHQPSKLIGRTAVDLLEDEITDPGHRHRHVSFPPELVIRDSTTQSLPATLTSRTGPNRP